MKYSFKDYINTLSERNYEANLLIDIAKISNNIREIEADLNALNYIICNNKYELIKRINFLFNKNKKCFKSLFILIGIRFDNSIKIKLDNNVLDLNQILTSSDNVINLIFKTKFADFILNGMIKNFVDYSCGVEVGMDTNARKNRNGNIIEKSTFEKLVKIFKDNDNIKITKQEKIKLFESNKVFDIVIHNIKKGTKILIESSYYNTSGSKINETNRGYFELYNMIKNYSSNYTFIWLADGHGMSTIKKQLEPNFKNGYIFNHKMFWENIREIVEKN